MLVELVGATYNFLTGALSNSKTKQMIDAKWRSIALTINSLGHGETVFCGQSQEKMVRHEK